MVCHEDWLWQDTRMSNLSQQIVEEIKTAMRAQDKAALTLLRSLKTEMQRSTIEKYGAAGELDEAEALAVVRKAIKQRQDSIKSFKEAGREELAVNEESEIALLEKYLPQQLSAEELAKMVEEVIAETGATSKKEMGQVIKALQEKVAGRADNKAISQEVAKRLS